MLHPYRRFFRGLTRRQEWATHGIAAAISLALSLWVALALGLSLTGVPLSLVGLAVQIAVTVVAARTFRRMNRRSVPRV